MRRRVVVGHDRHKRNFAAMRSTLMYVAISCMSAVSLNIGKAEDLVEFLKTHSITTTTTGCFKPGVRPSRNCVSRIYVQGDQLVVESSGCSSWKVPINGGIIASGTRVTANYSGDALSITLSAPNGLVFNEVTTLSPDRTQCSMPVPGCGSGWKTRPISCVVKAFGSPQVASTPSSKQLAGPVSNPGAASSCPPVAPSKYWQGTPNAEYCANANCVDRGSAYYGYVCYPPATIAGGGNAAPKGATSTAPRDKALARFKGVAPDVRTELLALGDSIVDSPDDDPVRDKLVRRLERRLTDLRVRMKPEDLACLQPLSGTSRRLQDIPLRWKPQHIKKEAINQSHLCDGVPEGDAKEACREEKYGQAVMWAEPELAGQCRTAEMPNNHDVEAVAECAKRKFLSAWTNSNGIASAPTPDNWIMPATCNAKASPAIRKQTLRDILEASLARAGGGQNNGSGTDNDQSTTGPIVADNPPSPPAATDENEAYCDYMARSVVRGELTPGPATAIPPECRAAIAAALALRAQQQADGASPFSMSAEETDREIARLLRPLPRTQAGGQ
jgi:hypothetical protein